MSPERITLDREPSGVRLSAAPHLQAVLDATVASVAERAELAGRESARKADASRFTEVIDGAVAAFEEARARAHEEIGRLAIHLGTEIARRILRHELPKHGYNIEKIVRETLSHARTGRGACVVHLHPDDVAALTHKSFRSNTVIEADIELSLGDVHVETPQGLLVRDTEELLSAIEESLLESLAE